MLEFSLHYKSGTKKVKDSRGTLFKFIVKIFAAFIVIVITIISYFKYNFTVDINKDRTVINGTFNNSTLN